MGLNFDSAPARRLPVYLLLDVSGSMAGEPISAVHEGVNILYNELMENPYAIETVWLSVITFAYDAQRTPLTEITEFKPPELIAKGPTALGAALRELGRALDSDIIANSPERKGDYKPLAFLLTDGAPTDEWRGAAQALKARTKARLGKFIALACGPQADLAVLQELADHTLVMRDLRSDMLHEYFLWVSASVKKMSVAAPRALSDTSFNDFPPPPPTIEMM